MTTETPILDLEKMIDDKGLSRVLNYIAIICCEKADHIASNYGDEPLTRAWDNVGLMIQRLADANSDL